MLIKVLQEDFSGSFDNIQVVMEENEEGNPKQYFIEGVFLQAEVKNHNQRVYPISTMRSAVDKYVTEFINQKRALGELGHPPNPNINPDRVSHKILSLKESGNNFIGKAKVLDTPFGRIAKNLMDEGVKMGVSSRGLGSLKASNGVNIVESNFRIITPADIVMEPSGPDCFVTNLLENKEWAWEGGRLIEKEPQVRNLINNSKDQTVVEIFNRILQMI